MSIQKTRILFESGSFKLVSSLHAPPGLENLILQTRWRSSFFEYTLLHASERINEAPSLVHYSLYAGARLIGNISFLLRETTIQAQSISCAYVRYFVFRKAFQANSNHALKKRTNGFLHQAVNLVFEDVKKLNSQTNRLIYGYIDINNAPSLHQGLNQGFQLLKSFKTLLFFRHKPKPQMGVRIAGPTEKPLIKNLLKSKYNSGNFLHFDNLFYKNQYYVLEQKGHIYAGCQVTEGRWQIFLEKKPLLKKFFELPFFKKYLHLDNFRFSLIDHFLVEPGYEEALFPLMEHVLFKHQTHFAFLFLETSDPLLVSLNNNAKLGHLNRFFGNKPVGRIAVLSDNQKAITHIQNNICFISGKDMI